MRKVTIIFLSVFFLFSLFQISSLAQNTPLEEKHIKIVKILIDDGYNKGNMEVADKYVAADYKLYVNGVVGETTGPEALKENIRYNRDGYEFTVSIVNVFCKENWCAVYWEYKGKHIKSGNKVKFNGVFLGMFSKGKIIKGMQFMDRLSQMEQLGYKLVPPEMPKTEK